MVLDRLALVVGQDGFLAFLDAEIPTIAVAFFFRTLNATVALTLRIYERGKSAKQTGPDAGFIKENAAGRSI